MPYHTSNAVALVGAGTGSGGRWIYQELASRRCQQLRRTTMRPHSFFFLVFFFQLQLQKGLRRLGLM